MMAGMGLGAVARRGARGVRRVGGKVLGVRGAPRKKRRSRAMFMRRGRVFIGFSAKEVKRALRRRGPTKLIASKGK